MDPMSTREHHTQVSLVRASLGLSPREGLGCWKPTPRSPLVERPTGIHR
jgi:hypothetical protein